MDNNTPPVTPPEQPLSDNKNQELPGALVGVASETSNAEPQAHNHRLKKILKYTLIGIIALPGICVVGFMAVLIISGQIKMNRLHSAADKKLAKLEQIITVTSDFKDAKGVVDGDALTAHDDPAKSTFAQLSFSNKSSLSEIDSTLAANLEQAGFVRDGGNQAPYYRVGSPAYDGNPLTSENRIDLRYVSSQDAVKITYDFDKYYSCPAGSVCERTSKTKPTDKVYDIRSFGSIPVVSVRVVYAAKNYYLTQL